MVTNDDRCHAEGMKQCLLVLRMGFDVEPVWEAGSVTSFFDGRLRVDDVGGRELRMYEVEDWIDYRWYDDDEEPAWTSPHFRWSQRLYSRSDHNPLSEAELAEIEIAAGRATSGPWFVRYLDDDHAANMIAVSTRPDTGRHERWPAFSGAELVAATVIQSPTRYVMPQDERWDENASFIARARSDVPRLVAEVRRLRELSGCVNCGSTSFALGSCSVCQRPTSSDYDYLETVERAAKAIIEAACREDSFELYLDGPRTPLQEQISALAKSLRSWHYAGDGCVDDDGAGH